MIGEKALRLNQGYPDEPQKWIPFTINETYLELMKESPEEYRSKEGKRFIKAKVTCGMCEKTWESLHVDGEISIQCTNCNQPTVSILLKS